MGIANIFQKLSGQKKGKITKQWEFQADSAILTSPVVGDLGGNKLIVFGTKGGKIYSLDDESKIKWLYSIQEKRGDIELLFLDEETSKSIRCSPVLADVNLDGKNEVIVGSDNGVLHVLKDDGTLLWEYKVNGPIRSSPCVVDINADGKPEIMFGCNDRWFYALNNDGSVCWRFQAQAPIESPAAVLTGAERGVVFGSNDGILYGLNADGTESWKYKTGSKITAQPAMGDLGNDGTMCIVVGSLDNTMYCFRQNGELLWKFETEGSIYSRACLADINNDGKLEVLFGSCDNRVYVLSSSGEKIWSYDTDFWVIASPFVVDIDNDGKLEIIAGSYDHSLYVLDTEGTFILNYMPGISGITQQAGHSTDLMTSQPGHYQGKKIWQYQTGSFIVGSTFLESRGRKTIVIGTKDGKLKLFTHDNGE